MSPDAAPVISLNNFFFFLNWKFLSTASFQAAITWLQQKKKQKTEKRSDLSAR